MRDINIANVLYEFEDDAAASLQRSGLLRLGEDGALDQVEGAIAGPTDVVTLLDLNTVDHRTHYSCVFAVRNDMVLLVWKNHPDWQAGRLNGIGGRADDGETALECADREFYEETGLSAMDLQEFHILEDEQVIVHFFRTTISPHWYAPPTNDRGETLDWFSIHPTAIGCPWIDPSRSIDNLCWLIPMAFSDRFHVMGRSTALLRDDNGDPV